MGPGFAYLNELLDGQLGFLLEQEDPAVITSVPGFLQALRSEPLLSIHLADLHEEAQQRGQGLLAEEHDGGNPSMLIELVLDELGTKLTPGPLADLYGRRAQTIRGLFYDLHHPFVLPFPAASREATGRVSLLLVELEKLAELAPPLLQLESAGHMTMATRNTEVQERARLRTRTDPGVALLRLEAVENVLLNDTPYAEPYAKGERAALRVEVVRSAVGLMTAAPGEFLSAGVKSGLRPIAEDVRQAAQLLVLDLRRRLYTVRSRLGVVQRFKARCEWHDRERLGRLADDVQAAGRSAEHALRDELTLYLFDQGLKPSRRGCARYFVASRCLRPLSRPLVLRRGEAISRSCSGEGQLAGRVPAGARHRWQSPR